MKTTVLLVEIHQVGASDRLRGESVGQFSWKSAKNGPRIGTVWREPKNRRTKAAGKEIVMGIRNVQGWRNNITEVTKQSRQLNMDSLITSEIKNGNVTQHVDCTLLFWSGTYRDPTKAWVIILSKETLKTHKIIRIYLMKEMIKTELEPDDRGLIIIGNLFPNDDSCRQEKEEL